MKGFIHLIVAVLLFAACTVTEEDRKSLLPYSSGQLAEVVVISDSESGDSLFNARVTEVFSKPIPGHPPPGEAVFKVLLTDESFVKGYFKTHHNIIVLLTEENAPLLKEVFNPALINKMISVIRKDSTSFGILQEEVFAKNQRVFFVLAKDRNEMYQKLGENRSSILELAVNNENISGKRKLLDEKSVKNDLFYQKCIEEKGFGVRRPEAYRVAIDNKEFVWLRKSSTTSELEQGILLYESKYTSLDDLTTENLIKVRNELVKKYIPGEIDGSYMKYSEVFTPVRVDQNFKDKFGVEIRGWWDVHGDFMGGPSYIRAVVDEAHGRIVFAEGFVFFPNENKAKPMRELEILVNTLSIK